VLEVEGSRRLTGTSSTTRQRLILTLTLLGKIQRRQVAQRTVRTRTVVILTPKLYDPTSFFYTPKHVHVQTLVTKRPVETLYVRILPRTSRLYVHRLHSPLLQPPTLSGHLQPLFLPDPTPYQFHC